MLEAENALIKVIMEEYEPWLCEEVPAARVTINIRKWVEENRPDLLKKRAKEEGWKI